MDKQIIEVNFEDFLRTGNFGEIQFGMTSNEILNLLGEPDFVFTHEKSERPTGFEYGNIEFYFVSHKDNRLCSIYLDEFNIPKGSQFLKIDAWKLHSGMSQTETEEFLIQAKIAFHPTNMPDSTMNGIITEGGVELGFIFEADEFSAPEGLYNISRCLRDEMSLSN